MDPGFTIRRMTFQDFELVISWINTYLGGNLSAGDTNSFFATDPSAFFIGELNGEPVAAISGVMYNNYAHVGFYFVKPDFRNRGLGSKMFQYIMETVKHMPSIGLDAVPAQVANYEKSGFIKHEKLFRYKKNAEGTSTGDLVDLRKVPIDQIVEYDQPIFGGNSRKSYLESVIQQDMYKSLGKIKDGKLVGYGILRKKTAGGYKFGSMAADDKETAEEIILGLQSLIAGEEVEIDILESNENAKKILEEQGWNYILSADRMYCNSAPKFDTKKMYANLVQIG